jgi:hypothetical protein
VLRFALDAQLRVREIINFNNAAVLECDAMANTMTRPGKELQTWHDPESLQNFGQSSEPIGSISSYFQNSRMTALDIYPIPSSSLKP